MDQRRELIAFETTASASVAAGLEGPWRYINAVSGRTRQAGADDDTLSRTSTS